MGIGRLLPAVLGIGVPTMMQVGPDDAILNLCKWPRKIWSDLPQNCLPGISSAWLYLAAGVLIAGSILWFAWPYLPWSKNRSGSHGKLETIHQNTQFDALEFRYEDAAPFVSVQPLKGGRLRRSISVAIANIGNGYISNVSVRIKSIGPDTGCHMPLNLDCGVFDLKTPGQTKILQLFSYPMSSDSAIQMAISPTGAVDYHPFIPKGSYVVGIEASGDQTKPVETYFRLWVDETDQLRIAMV